jgi:type I restriction enzyme S subunit
MSSKSKNLRALASSRETKNKEAKPALVPKLRFPEFRGKEPWKPVTLEEASTPVTERVGERKLTPVSISAGIGFVPQAEKFGRDISGNQYQLYTLVRDGDFVFNKGNSLKFPQGCIYLLQGWGEVAAPNVFICFRLKEGYSNGFYQQCFEQNQHGRQLKRHITSGARSNGLLNISKETFFGVEIPVPMPAEQQKIADCLSSVDALIAAQARKVDALKTHKKGLMQQLFPREGETQPRLRFPEFQNAGEWEVVALGDIAEIKLGKMLDKQKHTTGHLLPYLNNLAVRWNEVNTSDLPKMYFNDRELDHFGLRSGDVVVCEGGEPGRAAVWDGRLPDLKFQKAIHRVRFNVPFEPKILVLHLENLSGTAQFEMLFTGGGIKHLTGETFSRLKIPLFPHAEQQRIAACLSSLDALITTETQKHEALKTHKKALMQQLFPSPKEVTE